MSTEFIERDDGKSVNITFYCTYYGMVFLVVVFKCVDLTTKHEVSKTVVLGGGG